MRALLLHPEFPRSFWSFEELVKLHHKRTVAPPLGLLTVAALLPADWEVRLVDFNLEPASEADWAWAEVVLLSGMLVQREPLLDLVGEAKRRGKRVVVGGPYATTCADEVVRAGADFVVQGEAEELIADLCRAVEGNQPSRTFVATGKPDVERSPIPRYDLVDLDDYFVVAIQTSRGCPYDCEFCDVIQIYGRRPRYKSVDQLQAELGALYQRGWRGDIFLCDDNFIGARKRARELLGALIEWQRGHDYPFHFQTQLTLNLAQDDEMIDLLVQAGFRFVVIGVETPDENVLRDIDKPHNLRAPMLQALDHIRERGLDVVVNMVIGFDNEQPGVGRRVAEFIDAAAVPIVYLNVLQALPTTRFWDRLEAEGRLVASRTSGQTTGGRLNFVPDRSEAEIVAEYNYALDHIFDPENYFRRAWSYATRREVRAAVSDSAAGAPASPVGSISVAALRRAVYLAGEMPLLARLLWGRGLRPRYRRHFWRYLARVVAHNPDALVHFLDYCAAAEDLFRTCEIVRARQRESANPIRNPARLPVIAREARPSA